MNNFRLLFTLTFSSALEFYDFIIYLFFAPLIRQLFFPQITHYLGLLATFGIFAVGYLARPLGGIIFGHYGDTRGRKSTFMHTVMGMALFTFLIGLLPVYTQIGYMAPLLLVLLRIAQGFSLGGEVPGIMVYIAEMHPRTRWAFYASLIFVMLNVGSLLAAGVSELLHTYLSSKQLLQWGWRIPFFLGGSLAGIAYYLRRKIKESPLFLTIHAKSQQISWPLWQVWRKKSKEIIQGILLSGLGAVSVILLQIYMPSYLHLHFGYTMAEVSRIALVNGILLSLMVFFIATRITTQHYKIGLRVGSVGLLLISYPAYHLLSYGLSGAWIGTLLLTLASAPFIACYTAVLMTLFTTSMRYTGLALCFNVGFALLGSTAPVIATYLIHATQNVFSPCFYIISLSALVVWVMVVRERRA